MKFFHAVAFQTIIYVKAFLSLNIYKIVTLLRLFVNQFILPGNFNNTVEQNKKLSWFGMMLIYVNIVFFVRQFFVAQFYITYSRAKPFLIVIFLDQTQQQHKILNHCYYKASKLINFTEKQEQGKLYTMSVVITSLFPHNLPLSQTH